MSDIFKKEKVEVIDGMEQAAGCLRTESYDRYAEYVGEGIAEITRLRAENEKLREALKPFAHNYQNNGLSYSTFMFAMKDLLAAKKALGDTDE